MANTRSAPTWEFCDVRTNSQFLYIEHEYANDVRPSVLATDVDPERQGPLFVLAIGGQARLWLDDLEEKYGSDIFSVGRTESGRHWIGLGIICRALEKTFPTNTEAATLRSGLECFKFTRGQGYILGVLCSRFVLRLSSAKNIAKMDFSYEFRTWVHLSGLRLSPTTWRTIVKDIGHRMAADEDKFFEVRQALIRERVLGNQVFDLIRDGGSTTKGDFLPEGQGP